ncbi:Zinc finger, PHD-finger [Dillenia turbinata]|uniref:histone acetyltransferase n=1 Tax=Dillenia turbinata TaxID=194707 RepID=A0AAN8U6T6_9MAGN
MKLNVFHVQWVQCDKCEAWQHQICALFNGRRNDGGQAEYTCPNCHIKEAERGECKPLPQSAVLGAKDLLRTILERAERARLQGKSFDEVPGAESLVIRVVSSVDKKLEVKPRFLEIFGRKIIQQNFHTSPRLFCYFRRLRLRKMLDLLVHASQCRSPNCQYPNCRKVKGLFRHGIQCKVRASGGCVLCKKMWYLLQLHARACKESECHVPRCRDLKEHLRRLQQQSDSRRRAAVMEMMRQRAAEVAGNSGVGFFGENLHERALLRKRAAWNPAMLENARISFLDHYVKTPKPPLYIPLNILGWVQMFRIKRSK